MTAALFFERVFGHHFGKTILPLTIAVSAAANVNGCDLYAGKHLILNLKSATNGFYQARVNQEIFGEPSSIGPNIFPPRNHSMPHG